MIFKKTTEAIIDRFEGDFAVCEIDEGKFVNIPKELAMDKKEGDTIILDLKSL